MRKEIRKSIKVSPNVKRRIQRLIEDITIKKKETENQVIEKLLDSYEEKKTDTFKQKNFNPMKQLIKEDYKILR